MKEAAQKTKDTITTTETNSTAKEGASGHIRKTVTEKKPRPVFVIGHKNPDTDSICSAISYAWLKNQISDTEHLPKRAGNISRETQFVLDHFGVEAPELLTDVRPQIRDIDIRKAPGFDGHMSMREAWEYMRDNVLDTLCVTTENGSLEGLIAVKDIADAYLDLFDTAILGKAHTSYQNLLNTLEGKMLVGDPMGHIHKGRVHVGTSPETMISLISEGDIVLVTNRYEAQMIAIDLGASCMIVCVDSEVPERILEKARQSNCTVITTPYDTFAASRIVSMAAPVKHFMKKDRLLTFDLDLPLEDAMKVMASVRHRYFPVLDEDGQYVGVISRRNLLGMHRKKLILVDHNEKSQAVDGFQEARILEIIDHHRVGSLETSGPVYFRNEPLGCTASILYKMYKENDVEIPRQIAGLLMSAILSDTLLFRSPTCTPFDTKACKELAGIAGEDV
ncbi:MAG: putative manganese-dependent inorganic diphosphatase, partial [Lachnospiraceae bacterium]|nr:putative manganese-dependent inorganic diphosphatase [Lachnospiraceae bacterium]